MNAIAHQQFSSAETPPATTVDLSTVGQVLKALDGIASDPTARAAARIIRSLEVQILSLDAEIVDAEWRVISHAVEIERLLKVINPPLPSRGRRR